MVEYYVYVLINYDFTKTYTGITPDISKRLLEHNSGSNSYTRKYKPWKLFYSEKFDNRSEALRRERYFKSHAGRKYIKKLINNNPR